MNPGQLSNRELVSRLVAAGPDDPAWLEFVSRFHRRIRRITYCAYTSEAKRRPGLDVSLPGEIVEDLTQEVFVRLINGDRRALAEFRGLNEHSIYTYLQAIATNLVRDHFKKLRAQRRPPAAKSLAEPLRTADGPIESFTLGDQLPSPGPGPEMAAEAQELQKKIAEAVEQASRGALSQRDRLIARLFFIEELTMEEIASIGTIGLSASGVEKRIRKIRSAVKELLGEEGG